MKKIVYAIVLFSFILLAGCSESDGTSSESEVSSADGEEVTEQDTEEESEIEPEPVDSLGYDQFEIESDDTIAWMNAGPGEYGGENFNEEAVKAEIDQWPEGLEPEEYFHGIVGLTAGDYREYQGTLDTVDVEFEKITAAPDGEPGDEEAAYIPDMNVQILLDASGSMAGQVDGGVKMDLAKDAIADFAGNLPEHANVSLRVYGHAGTNQLDGKEKSCSTTEEVYSLGEYKEENFTEALQAFSPTGYTPLGLAMEEAAADLENLKGDDVQNVVYVVSDGKETCGGDPVAEAEAMQSSDIGAIVNIIGFDIEEAEREALEAIAAAGPSRKNGVLLSMNGMTGSVKMFRPTMNRSVNM
ncbi:VWA domain-containing protein [Virgibacillus ainsalahensis]